MSEWDEDFKMAKGWREIEKISPDGWEKEHAAMWLRYYLKRLMFLSVDAYDEP